MLREMLDEQQLFNQGMISSHTSGLEFSLKAEISFFQSEMSVLDSETVRRLSS